MLWGFQLSTITLSLIPITKSIKASLQTAASAGSWEFSVLWMTAIRLHTDVHAFSSLTERLCGRLSVRAVVA